MGNSRKTAFPTLFLGEYEHALDPQCRVTLPSEWRNKEDGTNLVLIPARDEALLLLPLETFMEFVERARKYAIANARMQAAFAYLGSQARNCRCDKQGRIALDRKMLDAIGVGGQLKLIGAITHIRICAPDKWQTPTPEAIAGHLSDIQSVSDGGSDADGLAALLGDLLKR